MKSVVTGFCFAVFGICVVIAIGSVFEYTTVYKNLAFDARHALMESGKIAIIPEISYIYVDCEEDELEEDYCDIDGQKEIEIIEYMEEDEFFDELMRILRNTKKGNEEVEVDLLYYTNNPFLAKIRVTTTIHGWLMKRTIQIEEAVIET